MTNESEKNTFKIDISKPQDDKQTPSTHPKAENTELSVNELEQRIAPVKLY